MSYRIYAFDGLELPKLRTLDQEHDMGTGRALTSYQQLPGGFFDHYGDLRSPQGIRPITLQGWLVESTTAALRTALDALRSKLGVRGKLTAAFEDGQLRWQWARLTNIETPSKAAHILSSPVELTFQTADQVWFGVVTTPIEWTWGDFTWVFGDGTAEYGEAGTSATLTANGGGSQNFTITNDGSLAATNLAISLTAGTNAVTTWQYINNTTQTQFLMGSVLPGEKMVIDSSDRSVWLYEAAQAITHITGDGTDVVVTVVAHGYPLYAQVKLFNTDWDGIHEITAVTTDTFTFADRRIKATAGSSGAVQRVRPLYSDFRQYNGQWPELAVGDNEITVIASGNAGEDATIGWEYYDHYA